MGPQPPGVSVVVTVRDEAESIGRLLTSLAAQTRAPDDVVVVDGGSTDGTPAILAAWAERGDLPLVVLSRPGANISAGRNAAIGAARGPIVACTDAGVRLEPGWIEALVAPFATGERFVAGFFASDPSGAFETALGATTLPERAEIDPGRFLPSSRSVAFRKEAWAAAGGYPEWLDYCEDLVFDFRLREAVGPAAFAPEAVAHFRPRPTLAAFARQYYRYARGDGKAGLWAGRHLVRYGTYLVVGPAVALVALRVSPWAWAALAAGLGAMLRAPFGRLARQWAPLSAPERVAAALWVPAIRVTGDGAKMVGYPAGLLWRWRHRPPAWRPAPEIGRLV